MVSCKVLISETYSSLPPVFPVSLFKVTSASPLGTSRFWEITTDTTFSFSKSRSNCAYVYMEFCPKPEELSRSIQSSAKATITTRYSPNALLRLCVFIIFLLPPLSLSANLLKHLFLPPPHRGGSCNAVYNQGHSLLRIHPVSQSQCNPHAHPSPGVPVYPAACTAGGFLVSCFLSFPINSSRSFQSPRCPLPPAHVSPQWLRPNL